MTKTIIARDFELELTLESGQFFQYKRYRDGFLVWVGEAVFFAGQEGDKIRLEGISEAKFRHIFCLDVDYSGILDSISVDEHMKKAIALFRGLRLMRQEFYECLIAYVCSANSNIPKITKNVRLMSEFYGKEKTILGNKVFLFPKPGLLCDEDRIREAKTGFRAKYICGINGVVDESWIKKLKGLDYESAKIRLMELPGVGPKVADCVLLFSLDYPEAFPIDVWIRRAMCGLYFGQKQVPDGEIYRFARAHFGRYCGWANQFLFLAIRNKAFGNLKGIDTR